MKLTRFGAGGAVLVFAAGIAFVGSTSAGAKAPPPVNVGNDHITCTTFYGTLKFNPAIMVVGSGPTTATVKATLDGCSDTDRGAYDASSNPGGVSIASSKLSGTIAYSSNGSGALLGAQSVTGAFTITWKVASATPKLVSTTTTLNFSGIDSSIVGLTLSGGPTGSAHNFSDSYGLFTMGADAAHGATGTPSVTGDFAGSDSGHTSTFDGISSGSVAALSGPSGIGAKTGIKQVSLGVGQIHVG
ncbi:MAG TPA: hypothetical protein VGI86_12440 [Acidimicrobiia bacterium]